MKSSASASTKHPFRVKFVPGNLSDYYHPVVFVLGPGIFLQGFNHPIVLSSAQTSSTNTKHLSASSARTRHLMMLSLAWISSANIMYFVLLSSAQAPSTRITSKNQTPYGCQFGQEIFSKQHAHYGFYVGAGISRKHQAPYGVGSAQESSATINTPWCLFRARLFSKQKTPHVCEFGFSKNQAHFCFQFGSGVLRKLQTIYCALFTQSC